MALKNIIGSSKIHYNKSYLLDFVRTLAKIPTIKDALNLQLEGVRNNIKTARKSGEFEGSGRSVK